MNTKIWAGVAGAVAASAVLYLLTRTNKNKIEVDLNVFTKDKLLKIIELFEIDHISAFIDAYSQLKANAQISKDRKISAQAIEDTKIALRVVCEQMNDAILDDNNISMEFLDQWTDSFKDDQDVQTAMKSMKNNYALILDFKKPEFESQPPEEITKDLLLKFITVSYTKFRLHVYRGVQAWIKLHPDSKLTDREFDKIWKEWSLSAKRLAIYEEMGFPVVRSESPLKTILKVQVKLIDDEELWVELFKVVDKHNQLMNQISLGNKIDDFTNQSDNQSSKDKEFKPNDSNSVKGKIIAVIEIDESCEEVKAPQSNKVQVNIKAKPKASSGFSFMGNSDKQQQLVDEFMSQNKQPVEQIKIIEEKSPDKAKESKLNESSHSTNKSTVFSSSYLNNSMTKTSISERYKKSDEKSKLKADKKK